jgi:hypothetical protein
VNASRKRNRNRFVALIPVGPAAEDRERLRDSLDSLFHYEPGVAGVVVVDDAPEGSDLKINAPESCRLVRVQNPRNGKGRPVGGGLCGGIIAGFRSCVDTFSNSIDFAVKIDTDALVIAPFAQKLHELFASDRSIGIAGAFTHTPNGVERDISKWKRLVTDLASYWVPPWRAARAGRKFPLSLFGKPARMREIVSAAFVKGYMAGQHCTGGAYAVTADALIDVNNARLFDRPLLWLDTAMSEDVLMSMFVRSTGRSLTGFCSNNQVFGVRHAGLPDTPDHLIQRGFSIIHSTKNDKKIPEAPLRKFFRNRRAGTA